MWLPHGDNITLEIEGALKDVFGQNGLQLTFRKINTHQNEGNVEFLDVNHVIDHNALHGFITKDFIEPTAINRTFFSGKSHYPPLAFQSITYCKAIRIRRLNKTQEGYLCSLERLHEKCLLSGFNNKMVVRILSIAKTWTKRFQAPPTPNQEESTNSKKTLVWATPFSNLIKLDQRKKRLAPMASIAYKKPKTLGSITNYKLIAHQDVQHDKNLSNTGSSTPCGKCTLCGHKGNHKSIEPFTNKIASSNGRTFSLKQNLT